MALEIWLTLLIVVPLAAALIMLCFPAREAFKPVYEVIHVLSIFFVGVVSIILIIFVVTGDETITAFGGLVRLDALGCIFAGLIGVMDVLVGIVALAYARYDLKRGALTISHFRTYYIFYQLFIFAMLVASAADNIILMWVAIEATMLATIFLVSTYNQNASLEAAWKYLVVVSVGVAFGLYGTILVYSDAHSVMANSPDAMLWSAMLPYAGLFDHRLMQIAFVFVAIGFGTKAGLFPMFTWVPDADSEAPPPISALLSGVLMAVAMLIIVRYYALTNLAVGSFFAQMVMLVLGLATVIVGAFGLFRQRKGNLMRMFGYSSCENLGVVAVGLGVGGPVGIAVALLHSLFHGFVKSLMFCLCGNVNIAFGTHDLKKVKAIIQFVPLTGVLL
ncbi:MAG: hydrogenase 4 subunit F, partial [Eggerthellaceae bacterium]|nr:hydrogenase 4 subunit F [Eggerthellaceae bacterium]